MVEATEFHELKKTKFFAASWSRINSYKLNFLWRLRQNKKQFEFFCGCFVKIRHFDIFCRNMKSLVHNFLFCFSSGVCDDCDGYHCGVQWGEHPDGQLHHGEAGPQGGRHRPQPLPHRCRPSGPRPHLQG